MNQKLNRKKFLPEVFYMYQDGSSLVFFVKIS